MVGGDGSAGGDVYNKRLPDMKAPLMVVSIGLKTLLMVFQCDFL